MVAFFLHVGIVVAGSIKSRITSVLIVLPFFPFNFLHGHMVVWVAQEYYRDLRHQKV